MLAISTVLYLRSPIENLFKLKLETYQVNTEDKEDQEDDVDDKKHRSKVNIDKNIEEKEFKIRNLTRNL